MSKETWFREYERLWNEREDTDGPQTDEELAQIAIERRLERADLAREDVP